MSSLKIGTVVFSLATALAASTTIGCGSSTSSGAGGGGTGGNSGAGAVNNCTAAAAKDETSSKAVTIEFGVGGDFAYSPACIKVAKGTTVTFKGAFGVHPLQAGVVDTGKMSETVDKTSPIKETTSGTSKAFTFPDSGTFGYYCEVHALTDDMFGAVIVE